MNSIESIFKLLSEPKRLLIWIMLMEDTYCVCDIERFLHLKQANVSRHLEWFRTRELVTMKRNFKWVHYSLSSDALKKHKALCDYIRQSSLYHQIILKLDNFEKDACIPKTQKAREKGEAYESKTNY